MAKSGRGRKKIRPEIIIISKEGYMPYAHILRKAKTDLELTDLGGNVIHIRPT